MRSECIENAAARSRAIQERYTSSAFCFSARQSHWEWHVHSSSPLMNLSVHLRVGRRTYPSIVRFAHVSYNPLGMISLPQVTRAPCGFGGLFSSVRLLVPLLLLLRRAFRLCLFIDEHESPEEHLRTGGGKGALGLREKSRRTSKSFRAKCR